MQKRFFFCSLFLISSLFYSQEHLEKGLQCFETYQLECAKEHFREHLVQNPENQDAWKYLGDIAVDQRDWEKAISCYKTILDADPTNADYHFKYGGAIGFKALNIGKINAFFLVDDIRDNFLEAARLDPNHLEVRWALVEFYVHLPSIIGGGTKKALRYSKELYALSKIDGLMSEGYIALEDGDDDIAKELYQKSVEEGLKLHEYVKDSTSGELKVVKSHYKYDRNQLHYQIGKAAFQYQKSMEEGLAHMHYFVENYGVKDHITKDWGYYFMAKMYKVKDDLPKAKEAITKALALRPDFKEALAFKKQL